MNQRILNEARQFTADHTLLMESLAKIYIKNKNYNSAGYLADSLLIQNQKGASHLINMSIMIQTNRPDDAIKYYKLFKQDGTNRIDYQPIVDHFDKFLEE